MMVKVNSHTKRRWKIIRDYILGWTLAFVFLSIVRGVGTEETGSLKFDFRASLLISFTTGPMIGIISGYFQILLEDRLYKKISILRLLLIRLLYAFGFILVLILLAYAVYQFYFGTELDIITFALDDGSAAIYFYVIFVDLFLNTVRQVDIMLGEGNLLKFIRGQFYAPREEMRAFMFIDLQSSTQLAESLGHIKYSSLIQDCFNDLGVVAEHEAEIYQYVGDEAVLTWPLKKGLADSNLIKAFFRFKNEIDKREQYYLKQYGLKPFFKAGAHSGLVTVTEIGRYKKEIAYHGDAVNTAARIQGQCNTLDEELLISDELEKQLGEDGFGFQTVGKISLRGKQESVELLGVKSKA